MAGQNTRRGLRELHGANAEIIELDADDAPTGRRYAVVKPDPLAGWPGWLKWPLFTVLFLVLMVALACSLYITGVGLFWLWTLFFSH